VNGYSSFSDLFFMATNFPFFLVFLLSERQGEVLFLLANRGDAGPIFNHISGKLDLFYYFFHASLFFSLKDIKGDTAKYSRMRNKIKQTVNTFEKDNQT
jgi:hypothetical protein